MRLLQASIEYIPYKSIMWRSSREAANYTYSEYYNKKYARKMEGKNNS
jgi:hypothetical protein